MAAAKNDDDLSNARHPKPTRAVAAIKWRMENLGIGPPVPERIVEAVKDNRVYAAIM